VLVFVMGAFAEMSGDVNRICGIIARDLVRNHVSYYNYNDDAKRTKVMCRISSEKACFSSALFCVFGLRVIWGVSLDFRFSS